MPSGVYERSDEYKHRIGEIWRKRHQDPEVIAKRAASHAARPWASCLKCRRKFQIGRTFDKHRLACFNPKTCSYGDCVDVVVTKRLLCSMHQAIADRCHKYDITVEQYMQMWIQCDGKCQGCRRGLAMHGSGASKAEVLHIDHNEITGRVRGFLCHSCNLSIGYAHHDVDVLERLIDYLRTE